MILKFRRVVQARRNFGIIFMMAMWKIIKWLEEHITRATKPSTELVNRMINFFEGFSFFLTFSVKRKK
jgi:hypothetical protein